MMTGRRKSESIPTMPHRILVTGGAGFIGNHLCRRLIREGHDVRALDNLTPQVHGADGPSDGGLPSSVEFVRGDVRDALVLLRALEGIDVVFHLAAQTGVAQSMYQLREYISCNVSGTATLLDLVTTARHRVEHLVVASSRAVYGEGKYHCEECGVVFPPMRSVEQMDRRDWEVHCPNCHRPLTPLPTDEDKPLQPGSVYAISKRDQEELCLCVGRTYRIPTTVLRFFNVYGSGQSLSNPYSGIVPIFAARLRNGQAPVVYELGEESRDFVHVSDAVEACVLCMNRGAAYYEAINVGSGIPLSVLELAKIMIEEMQAPFRPEIVDHYRVGDIRHCFADLAKARRLLGYQPACGFERGIREFLRWAAGQHSQDQLAVATRELVSRDLFR